jgi:hypothetical protein
VAELEARLTGSAQARRLDPDLARSIPAASSVVLVLFDGLGDLQLDHPAAAGLAADRRGRLDGPFPTTTTVSMATIATGTAPVTHGLVSHLLWLPELGRVVNTLKWVDLTGAPVDYPTHGLLPAPNLWERLAGAGIGAVTVQPAGFASTPLTTALYRGCRFAGADTVEDFVQTTLEESSRPGTFVFTYLPPVDVAAHVSGRDAADYREALQLVAAVWKGIKRQLPDGAVMVGTADHGVPEIPEQGKQLIRDSLYRPLDFWGDPRALMVRGSARLIRRLAADTGAELVEPERFRPWLGPGPEHRQLGQRLPDAILLAPPGTVLLPPGFDKRLVGYHGGLTTEELAIPLLVAR